jgi:UDP-N-acetylglucosamine--N-acetylmuramyl-(pentapeptide) pyrophosphoryl-undecaprenol N-acetylglucosamine transferase
MRRVWRSSFSAGAAARLPQLSAMTPPPRIVHQTGPEEFAHIARAYDAHPGLTADVRAFLDDMPRRLAEADLVVCRAGATTLAELAVAGRPAILVPFPFAADDHQRANAEAVRDAGAAVVIEDGDLDGARCATEIGALADDRPRRLRMAAAARTLARPGAAAAIADVAEALLKHKKLPHVP